VISPRQGQQLQLLRDLSKDPELVHTMTLVSLLAGRCAESGDAAQFTLNKLWALMQLALKEQDDA
jgi:hypothetical protein